MKLTTILTTTILALSASGIALAQPGAAKSAASATAVSQCAGMQGMNMKDMNEHNCKATEGGTPAGQSPKGSTNHATGVVKAVDPAKGTVTFAHGPVASLHWPAMTMSFTVADKSLLGKLSPNQTVDFEFKQQGKDYVVTAVK